MVFPVGGWRLAGNKLSVGAASSPLDQLFLLRSWQAGSLPHEKFFVAVKKIGAKSWTRPGPHALIIPAGDSAGHSTRFLRFA